MVRRVRISRDEFDGLDPSRSPRDSFDDLDDFVLDAVARDAPARGPDRPRRKRRKPAPDVRRHLADADWLRDPPSPPRDTGERL